MASLTNACGTFIDWNSATNTSDRAELGLAHTPQGGQQPPMPNWANNANSANEVFSLSRVTLDAVDWEPPIPLHAGTLPPFPTAIFPDWLAQFVDAVAVATQTPPDLPGMLALAVLATACAKTVEVEVRPGWIEPVNLYTIVALESASRKSAVFRAMVEPLLRYEQILQQKCQPVLTELETRRKILNERLRHLQKEAAKAHIEQRAEAEREALQVALELEALPHPSLPRLFADDVSPEALVQLLARNQGRMAVLSAEADIISIMLGRYGGAPNLEVFLKAHAGDPIRVDRVLRASERIDKPALTMGLTTQPTVIRGLILNDELNDRGLLARFLYAMPASLLGSRRSDAPPVPEEISDEYGAVMHRLLTLTHETTNDEQSIPHLLRLDGQAHSRIIGLQDWLEPQLPDHKELELIRAWAGKLAGTVARIAGLLHMADHVDDLSPWDVPITSDTVERAIRLGTTYLLPHAQAVFMEMGADPVIGGARYLLGWIEKRGVESFTKRDAFEATKGRFKRAAALDQPLQLLVDTGYIRLRPREATSRPGRKPSPRYDVNPYVHKRSHPTVRLGNRR